LTLPQVISRNQVQKTNKRTILQQDTGSHPITYYTCPTGKIAVIKGNIICSSTGTGSEADLIAGGISQCEWQSSGGGTIIQVPQDLAINVLFPFEINLKAAETLVSQQSSGTNANMTINCVVEEFNI